MSNVTKIIWGIGSTLFVLLAALFFFLRSQVTKSFPQTNGKITVNGIHAPVDVYRDELGVPHISAQNEDDLMFATGYIHAQDRLWQMELARRAGEGRLSEVFDSTTITFDKLFRTLGFYILAESLAQHLHPESKRLLENYTAGINDYITTHKGKYPIEFDMLNYEQPEPWQVKHSLLVARLMAWELNFAWWVDLTYAELSNKVSPEKLKEIFPSWSDSLQTYASSPSEYVLFANIHPFLTDVKNYRDFFQLGSLGGGSNAWAVNASKSLSGKPLLANDPHLKISVPSKWYELHLSAPGWNAAGVSVPGIPFIVIGHNDSLAWGLTNAMLDDADFYIEKEDSLKRNFYRFKNSVLKMQIREELIYIGKSDSISIVVRSSHHGPIVNDVHPTRQVQNDSSHISPIALRWTGFDMSDEFFGFYNINISKNKKDFEKGLKELTVPGQNVVYADAAGNIGYWTAGRVPIRSKYNAMLPQSGWTGASEWQGYVPFEQLPKSWNPREGFIVCANQNVARASYRYYLSTLWEPSSRFERIRELLLSTEKFTADDFKQLQQDNVSLYDKELTHYILQAFEHDSAQNFFVVRALEYLRNWDFRCTSSDIATTIVETFFNKLIHNTYEDEIGSDVFRDFVYFSAIPYRVTSQLLRADSSVWFDDVRTTAIETRDDIIRKSLVHALEELKSSLGDEMKTWRWGIVHAAEFEHPFGKRKPLDRVFNVGPFPIGGSATTINKADYPLSSPYGMSACPSMRQVIDLAKPNSASIVLTLGQSGQPLHQHYNDQTPLWLNGGYHTVTTNWNEIRKAKWNHLELIQQSDSVTQ